MTYEKEIAIAGLSALGIVALITHQDGGIVASVVTGIATIAGVFVGHTLARANQ
jgi:hypothetical protein